MTTKQIKESRSLQSANVRVEKAIAELRSARQLQKELRNEEWPTFEIWQGAYKHSRSQGRAKLHGKQVAKTFREACEEFFYVEGNLFWYKSRCYCEGFFSTSSEANDPNRSLKHV